MWLEYKLLLLFFLTTCVGLPLIDLFVGQDSVDMFLTQTLLTCFLVVVNVFQKYHIMAVLTFTTKRIRLLLFFI